MTDGHSTARAATPIVLTFAAVALAVVATAAALVQTTIPLAIDAEIESLVLHHRSDPATRFWTMELDNGRTLIVDRSVDDVLEPGDHVHKAAWSRTVEAAGRRRSLPLPATTLRVGLAGLLLAALTAIVAVRPVPWWSTTARPGAEDQSASER